MNTRYIFTSTIELVVGIKILQNVLNVLFRTRNLGQHFFDISKKNDVNQSLASLINDNC
jgi:ABC-type phosphate/phosphonate transport system ATPase subunit